MKKQMSLSCFITLATLGLILSSAAALANDLADTYGFSAKGISMGNAMTAIVDDWSSVYYNVAGLGRTTHLRTTHTSEDGTETEEYLPTQIAINYFYTAPQFNLNIPTRYPVDSAGNRVNDPKTGLPVVYDTPAAKGLDFHAIALGMVFDLTKVIKFPDIVSSARFGLTTAFTDLGYATKANDLDLRTHDFMRYGREAQKMIILTGVGIGYLEDLFGLGLGFNMNFHGRVKSIIQNVDLGPDEQTPQTQSKMDLQIAPAFTAGFYTNIKRVGGSHIDLNIGISYRQESFLEIYPYQAETITKPGAVDMLLDIAVFDYYTPHIVTAGVAASIGRLTISAQLDIELWSKFRLSKTMIDAFANMQKDAIAGGDTRSYKIPKFRDIYIPRVGLSAKIADWMDVLAGYYFQQTFVPNYAVEGVFNFLDSNKHVVSFGARIGLPRLSFINGQTDLIIGAQFQILEKRTVEKPGDPNNTINPPYSYDGWNPTITAELSMKI